MTDDELKTIEERSARATAGPWRSTPRYALSDTNAAVVSEGMVTGIRNEKVRAGRVCEMTDNGGRYGNAVDADAEFIAASRTDVPALIAEVRRLRAAIEKHRESFSTSADEGIADDELWSVLESEAPQ